MLFGSIGNFRPDQERPCSQVVPGKFVAFKGPVDLGSLAYRDDGGYRKFSPSYYLPIFAYLGISTVVRSMETA